MFFNVNVFKCLDKKFKVCFETIINNSLIQRFNLSKIVILYVFIINVIENNYELQFVKNESTIKLLFLKKYEKNNICICNFFLNTHSKINIVSIKIFRSNFLSINNNFFLFFVILYFNVNYLLKSYKCKLTNIKYNDSFEIQLLANIKNLGNVHIKLNLYNKKINLNIVVLNKEISEMLRYNVSKLITALANKGIIIDSYTINYNDVVSL